MMKYLFFCWELGHDDPRTKESFKCILLLWHSAALSWATSERCAMWRKGETGDSHLFTPRETPENCRQLSHYHVTANCRNIFKSSPGRGKKTFSPHAGQGKSIEAKRIAWKFNLRLSTAFLSTRLDQFDIEILNFPTHLTKTWIASMFLSG